MDTITQSTTILLVSENPSVIESTRTEKEVNSKNLFPVIAETQPDVILLDFEFQQHPFDLVDEIASKYSMCAVVAILSESEKVDSDRVLLSGARDFIQYPYQSDNLVITIKRVIELLEHNQAQSSLTPVLMTNQKIRLRFSALREEWEPRLFPQT